METKIEYKKCNKLYLILPDELIDNILSYYQDQFIDDVIKYAELNWKYLYELCNEKL